MPLQSLFGSPHRLSAKRLAYGLWMLGAVAVNGAALGACGPFPATYPLATGSELDVKENVTMNGNPVAEGKTGADSVVATDGARSTVNQALPALDPATFPANNSNTKADESDAPFNASSDVYYDEITIGENETVAFTGGGPFHINKLEVKKNAVLNLAAGIYYIDELILEDGVTLNVTSEAVVIHIGDKADIKKDVTLNSGGKVSGLGFYLHKDTEFKGDEGLDFTGFLYGPEAETVELKKDTTFHGAIVTDGIVKIEEDTALIYTAADQTELGAVSTCITPTAPVLLAYWQLDEASWTGANGEAIDQSGNGNHGAAIGGASTGGADPAISGNPGTCRFGAFALNTDDATQQAVDTGVDIDDEVGSSGSVSLWYSSNLDWSGGGDRMLLDASTTTDNKYFFLVLLNDGHLRFGLEDDADADLRFDSSNVYAVGANQWKFLTVNWDLSADTLEIYVDGVLDRSFTSASTGQIGELGTLFLGDNRSTYHPNGTPNSANGRIDEVRIYDQPLSAAEILALMAETHPCAGVDHYAISHDGNAINCQAEPVTLTAHMADHSVDTSHTGGVTLSTSTGHGDWTLITGAGTLTNSGNGQASYVFVAGDNGTVELGLKNSFVEALNINASDGSVSEAATEDPDLAYAASGFAFLADGVPDTIGTQIAGKASNIAPGAQTLELQAIRTSDTTGACEAALAGAVAVDLAFECRDPASCAGAQVSLNGTPIAANDSGSVSVYSAVNLDFGDLLDTTAPIALAYPDAGKIRLYARFDIPLGSGAPSGNLMSGASNEFVVRPFGLDIDFSDDRQNNGAGGASYAADANGSVFTSAGSGFSTTVTAVVWSAADDADNDGAPDAGANLANNMPTPNFGQELAPASVTLTTALKEPAGGSLGSLTGNTFTGFAGGAASSTVSYSEVGIADFSATLNNYLAGGQNIAGQVTNVGRFIPARFTVTGNSPAFANGPPGGWACGFTYLDQTFGLATAPELTVTALSATGATTNNYAGPFWKFSAAYLPARQYTEAGLDAPLTGAVTAAGQNTFDGVHTFTDNNEVFSYDRAITGLVGPFSANVTFSVTAADLTDSDGVCYHPSATCNSAGQGFSLTGITGADLRFGRLNLQNAVGSELLALGVPALAEFYDGAGFATNTADACTTLSTANLDLVNDVADPALGTPTIAVGAGSTTASIGNSPLAAGDAGLSFTAPGANNTGYSDLLFNLTAAGLTWLQFDWDGDGSHDDNPTSRASFGLNSGSRLMIYLREPW